MTEKIRTVWVPFLFISGGCVVGYTFLDWLLFIKFEVFPLDEGIVLIWLRPRIGKLHFKNSTHRFDYQVIAWVAIAVPTVIAQYYITTATGMLTQLDRVSEIDRFTKTKYYSIAHYSADKNAVSSQVNVRPSGTRHPELVFSIFFVAPMHDSAADSTKFKSNTWLAIGYSDRISDRVFDSTTEQQNKLKKFVRDSIASFNKEKLDGFSYFERINPRQMQGGFREAAEKNPIYVKGSAPIILVGERSSFESRNGQALGWTLGTFGAGAIIWLSMLVIPKIGSPKWIRDQERAQQKERQILKIVARGGEVTLCIAAVNILIFLVMAFSGLGVTLFDAHALISWGANYSPLVHQGQWFRLVTSMFLHGGLAHLAANMYGLLLAGILLEPLLGKLNFAVLYFVAGIVGSLCSIWFHPATASVGASAAIFGLYGALLVGSFLGKHDSGLPILSLLIFIGANLLIGSVTRGIDNAAHVGGLISGALMGAVLFTTARSPRQTKCQS